MLGHAPPAPLAVLTPQRRPDHARHAEVALVELPLAYQLVNDGLLLGDARHLGHEARVEHHRARVEVRRQRVAHHEPEVEPGMRLDLLRYKNAPSAKEPSGWLAFVLESKTY